MRSHLWKTCRFLLLAFVASSAHGAELDILSAYTQALERNTDVRSAREGLLQSEANFSFAKTKALPTVVGVGQAVRKKDASLSTYRLFGGRAYDTFDAYLSLEQPLFDTAIFAGYRYSKKDQDVKRYQVAITERATTLSLLQSFYTVLLSQRTLQILRDTYNVTKGTLSIAERYYHIGRAQKLDVLQLKTQVALLPPQISAADAALHTATAQLSNLVQDSDPNQLRLQGGLVNPDPAWVRKAAQEHRGETPEVAQAKKEVEQFEDYRSLQMATYWPKLDLTGQVGRFAYNANDLWRSRATSWSATLELTIPIFNSFGSIYQSRALAAQGAQTALNQERTMQNVSVSAVQTKEDLDTAEAALRSTKEAATYGRESLKEAERQYRLQTINYLQYQSSQQAYLTTETQYAQAKYNYIIAIAKYFTALGVPLDVLVNQLQSLQE